MRMKNDFHIKGCAPTLILKQRPGGTRKWPIFLILRHVVIDTPQITEKLPRIGRFDIFQVHFKIPFYPVPQNSFRAVLSEKR